MIGSFSVSSKRCSKLGIWRIGSSIIPIVERHRVVSVHSLQSCKPGVRVLDEYSAYTTTAWLWGWVSGCPAPRGALQARSHIPGARRPSWHVEPTHRARFWRFTSYLNRAISVLPVWCRRMNRSCRSDAVSRSPPCSRRRRRTSPGLSNLSGGGILHEDDQGGALRPRLVRTPSHGPHDCQPARGASRACRGRRVRVTRGDAVSG